MQTQQKKKKGGGVPVLITVISSKPVRLPNQHKNHNLCRQDGNSLFQNGGQTLFGSSVMLNDVAQQDTTIPFHQRVLLGLFYRLLLPLTTASRLSLVHLQFQRHVCWKNSSQPAGQAQATSSAAHPRKRLQKNDVSLLLPVSPFTSCSHTAVLSETVSFTPVIPLFFLTLKGNMCTLA